MLSPRKTIFHAATLVAALAIAFSSSATAHEIPNDITIQAFLRPEGHRLRLLVRIPLTAMRDFNFPEKGRDPYLDINGTAAMLPNAATLWISDFVEVYEGDTKLGKPTVTATQLSLLSDRSFASYEQALAHVTGPALPEETNVVWNQTMLDAVFEYPIESDQSRFSVNPDGWWRLGLRVLTVFRFVAPNGAVRAFEFLDAPGLVRMDPRWYQAALNFVHLGFLHILEGTDHLLFLFCLVIPFRRFRSLIPIVTSFTVAHSITLIASAYNLAPDALWFPPLIETLIAASIVYMALENIVGAATVHRRWMITFGFGLVHGFGFSFALRQTLQFAGSHMLTSLLSFNVGVELGQLLVLLLLIPMLEGLFRFAVAERMGTIILSALVAHTGWHWMIDRGEVLARFRFQWPVIDAAFLASLLRWLMALVAVAGAFWLITVLGRLRAARNSEAEAEGTD
ncbi:MAG TPA: HupE/UreJ family protein [Bryobacteraceae bacterium]|nr:HupE/UreJ family protein [Bryobacteraceae bacterium]